MHLQLSTETTVNRTPCLMVNNSNGAEYPRSPGENERKGETLFFFEKKQLNRARAAQSGFIAWVGHSGPHVAHWFKTEETAMYSILTKPSGT